MSSLTPVLAATAAAALVFSGATLAAADDSIAVDPQLESCIQAALVSEGLTVAEADQLKRLTCGDAGEGVATLEGIEQLTGLGYVGLTVAPSAQVKPLEQLTGLTGASLKGFGKQDFSGLAQLQSMTVFELSESAGIGAEDLAFIGEMTQLESLTLRGNGLTALPAVDTLVSLKTLSVERNRLTTLDGLQSLPRLISIDADRNHVTDVAVFNEPGAFPRLARVSLNVNRVTDTSPVNSIRTLETSQFVAQIVRMDPTALNTWNSLPISAAWWDDNGPTTRDVQPRHLRGEGLEMNETSGQWQMTSPGTFYLGWSLPSAEARTPFSGVIVQTAQDGPTEEELGLVSVWHLDEEGNEVADSEFVTGEVGTPYAAPAAKELVGYEYVRTEGEVAGAFSADPISVVHVYAATAAPVLVDSVVAIGADQTVKAGSDLTFTVTRENAAVDPWTGETSVEVRTQDDTALAGADYEALAVQLVWADQETAPKTVTVKTKPAAEGAVASEKQLALVLSAPGENTTLGSRTAATGVIVTEAADEIVRPDPKPEVKPDPTVKGELAKSGQAGSFNLAALGAAAMVLGAAGLVMRRKKTEQR
ncbi:MucBP domain-containing protein [Leucobacter sp. BZR 635]